MSAAAGTAAVVGTFAGVYDADRVGIVVLTNAPNYHARAVTRGNQVAKVSFSEQPMRRIE